MHHLHREHQDPKRYSPSNHATYPRIDLHTALDGASTLPPSFPAANANHARYDEEKISKAEKQVSKWDRVFELVPGGFIRIFLGTSFVITKLLSVPKRFQQLRYTDPLHLQLRQKSRISV